MYMKILKCLPISGNVLNGQSAKGRNIPCDLHVEHLNRELKKAIAGLGANITKEYFKIGKMSSYSLGSV